MTIDQRIAEIFHSAGIPGFKNYWRKSEEYPEIPDKFCTYVVTLEADPLCADDTALIHQSNITVHMYGKTDLTEEQKALRAALLHGGFSISRQSDLADVYSGDWRYHKRFDLIFFEEV